MEKLINTQREGEHWKINEKVKNKQKLKFTDKSLLLFASERERARPRDKAEETEREIGKYALGCCTDAYANSMKIEFMANVTALQRSFTTHTHTRILMWLGFLCVYICKQTQTFKRFINLFRPL